MISARLFICLPDKKDSYISSILGLSHSSINIFTFYIAFLNVAYHRRGIKHLLNLSGRNMMFLPYLFNKYIQPDNILNFHYCLLLLLSLRNFIYISDIVFAF